MNETENNHELPNESLLDHELTRQAKLFKIHGPDNLNELIFERLEKESQKKLPTQVAFPIEWLKLAAVACFFITMSLIYLFNSQSLYSIFKAKPETVSLFTLFEQTQEKIRNLNLNEKSIETRGKLVIATMAQGFISDLALLTIDPTHEFMQSQQPLKENLGIK